MDYARLLTTWRRANLSVVDSAEGAVTVESLLDALAMHEHDVRKYRTRGDARAEHGNHRSATEYHILASQSSRLARNICSQLTEILGPDGGPGLPVAAVLQLAAKHSPILATVADQGSFEDACFYMRHPHWARLSGKLLQAYRRWLDTPALQGMAPEYHPIWSSWTD